MDDEIEQEIQAKGKTAPRVTPQTIGDAIVGEFFFSALEGADAAFEASDGPNTWEHREQLGCLTFCVLVLRNGFTVTGESACASPENYDYEIGRKIARQNAIAKIWPLEGYLLRDRLHCGT